MPQLLLDLAARGTTVKECQQGDIVAQRDTPYKHQLLWSPHAAAGVRS